jgi:replicative DNA helicase
MSQGSLPDQGRLPFGVDFQKSLLRLLIEDDSFAQAIAPHLQPQYFANEIVGWAFGMMQRYHAQYGGMPSIRVLLQETTKVDERIRPAYQIFIEQIGQSSLSDEQYMRDQTLDFVKRNIFVRTYQETRQLYNAGSVEKAYDLMMERMQQITTTTWEPKDESWFFENFAARQTARLRAEPDDDAITTGLKWLDHILNGGLHIGELGIWIAYAKGGKSTMLVNHGIAATTLQRKRVAHFVFEGARKQVEDRYDAGLMEELYQYVRRGEITGEKYSREWERYQLYKGLLWIRGFTQRWDYSVVDVHAELRRLKQQFGWVPDLVIIDYGDLLRGREKHYANETEKQKAAFQDLKSLSNRGYAVWTASQARRPDKGSENRAHWIYSREIADCYAKIRIGDFLGSINSTIEERSEHLARLLAELYRDNDANQSLLVRADFSRMIIREEAGLVSPSLTDTQPSQNLGQRRQQLVRV